MLTPGGRPALPCRLTVGLPLSASASATTMPAAIGAVITIKCHFGLRKVQHAVEEASVIPPDRRSHRVSGVLIHQNPSIGPRTWRGQLNVRIAVTVPGGTACEIERHASSPDGRRTRARHPGSVPNVSSRVKGDVPVSLDLNVGVCPRVKRLGIVDVTQRGTTGDTGLHGGVRYDIGSVAAGIPVAGHGPAWALHVTALFVQVEPWLPVSEEVPATPKVPAQTVSAFPQVLKLPLSAIPHVIAFRVACPLMLTPSMAELGAPSVYKQPPPEVTPTHVRGDCARRDRLTVDSKNLHEIGRLNSSDEDFDIVGVAVMWP